MSAPGPIDEVTAPVKVGAGSFGAVFVVRGGPVAFKIAHVLEHHETLRREYEALTYLYGNSTSFFRIPKPFAFHYSQDNILLAAQPTLRSPPNTRTVYRQPAPVDRSFFDVLQNDNPVYAMSRVFALPANIGAQISAKFLPDGITAGPNLLRLYFGKTLASNNSPRFINTANFPMDLFRYEWLRTVVGEKLRMDLPSAEEVALEIGETLGRIHWSGGYDGRDIEFVMGGDGFANVEFYVIDFNQMRPWSRSCGDLSVLVDSYFQNDPYYPRPRDGGTMYKSFCLGYIQAYPPTDDSRGLAQAFLKAIEEKDGVQSDPLQYR